MVLCLYSLLIGLQYECIYIVNHVQQLLPLLFHR
ncbi:hypothetical protein [Staphylococcus phage vB_SauM-V1SA22]|nr:hypothetical protein [Staphylococcus phage vB_SauM-V1SA22]